MPDVARPFAASNAREEAGQMPARFVRERTTSFPPRSPLPPRETGPDFDRIQHGKEFVSLRKTFRRFVFPMSLLFFTWYMTFVLLAAYAHDFMSKRVFGEINVGIIMGLGQFASTILITIAYVKFANRRIDPKVEELRAMVRADER
jgi:uncharacterized membrane protein (DUF485 family)